MKNLLKYIIALTLAAHSISAAALQVTPFAELLVWHASQEPASAWASVITASPESFTPKNNNFGWDPGFRGGIAFAPESYFDTQFYWTYFGTESKDKIPLGAHIITPEFFSGFVSDNFFFGAQQDWNMTINLLDLEISHAFNVTQNFTLRPSVGIKGASINQKIDTLWQADIYNATEKVKSNYLGIGPSFGLRGVWDFAKTFAFVADVSTAFMWGKWDVTDTYKRPYVPLSLTPDATTIKTELNDSELGTLMLQYFVGLKWSPDAFPRVNVELGYEMQYWANQLRLITFQQLPTHGDLTLQGGTCSFSIDF